MSSVERLAIVGASVRAAAYSAIRAGFQVVAADLFADEDLRRVAPATRIGQYPEGFLDWLRGLRPKPTAWMYTGGLENHPELVDALAAEFPLLGIGGESLRRVRTPQLIENEFQEAGLLFPETRAAGDGLPRDGSWLVKTGRGAGGTGVAVLDMNVDVQALGLGCVFQRRVAGTCGSAVFVAAGGVARLLGIARQLVGEKWLNAGEFQYCGAIAPWPVGPRIQDTITEIGNVLAERFELVGLFGVDLMIDGETVWTIEVNPRYTASIEVIERATGLAAVAAHVAACRDGELLDKAVVPSGALHTKAVIFSKQNFGISKMFARSMLEESARMPWPTTADVSSAGTMIGARRPVVTVFATGETLDECERKIKLRVANVERDLYGDRPGDQ